MTEPIPTVPQYIVPQDQQPHCRIVIRRWIKELMIVNTDINRDNWHLSRPDPVFLEESGSGFIYFNDEPADHQGTAPRNYLRTTQIVIQPTRRMDSERPQALEDWLDSRAFEIEGSMLADRFLGQKALLGKKNFIEDTVLVRTQPAEIIIDGADSHHSSIGLFFNIMWRSAYATTATLEEFLSFINDIQGTEGEDAIDNVTIRTS